MSKKRFSDVLSTAQRIELDACTGCAECLKYCPVQEVTKNPAISPPAKIKAYRDFIKATEGLKARLFGKSHIEKRLLEDFTKAVFECTTCGACGQHCSVGIFSQRLWPMMRKEMVRRGLGPIGVQAKMPELISKHGNPYNKPAQERFSPWMPEGVELSEKAKVAYYAGCTGAYCAQPMVRGDVTVLAALGEPFTMLKAEEEVCCGFPLFISGQHDMLEELVRRLVEAYKAKGVERLICSCPCCVNIMIKDWPAFYGRPLPFKIVHITQHVSEAIKTGRLRFKKSLKQRLIYHDPCYLSRGVGIIEEPRFILRSIEGVELIEFQRHGIESRCCGAGGAARKVFEENANLMGRITIDEAVRKRADRLVLSCPACYDQLHKAMIGHVNSIQITDLMELVAQLVT